MEQDDNLIPDVTTLPGVPENLKTAILKFPAKLLAWKDKLRTIHPMYGIWTMLDLRHHFGSDADVEDWFLFNNENVSNELSDELNKDNPGGICSSDSRTLEDLLRDGVIIMFVGFACHEQFIGNSMWPEHLLRNDPELLVAEFRIGNVAVVRTKYKFDRHGYKGAGSLFWTQEELEFQGTWEETFAHLVKLYTKVGKSFTMDDAEIPDPTQG